MGEMEQDDPLSRIPVDWENRLLPRLLEDFPKVLLVDDSPFFANILATFFKLEGFKARAAYGGFEALQALTEDPPDIAFVDIVMPDLSGLEIARKARVGDAGKTPLLVALSGWDEPECRQEAMEAGFDYFMLKPVDPSSLREFLARLLD